MRKLSQLDVYLAGFDAFRKLQLNADIVAFKQRRPIEACCRIIWRGGIIETKSLQDFACENRYRCRNVDFSGTESKNGMRRQALDPQADAQSPRARRFNGQGEHRSAIGQSVPMPVVAVKLPQLGLR